MISIKKFTEIEQNFKELARIDNLVSHDSISHPDDQRDSWEIRDKNLIKDRLLLYNNALLVGVMYYTQGRDQNNRTTFFTLNIDPKYNNEDNRQLLYYRMLDEIKEFHSNKIFTSVYDHQNYYSNQKFFIENGFKLVQTNREYSCDIRKLDTKKYYPLIKKLELEGIEFYDSKDQMLDFKNHFKKLEELEWIIDQDIPIPDGIKHTRMPFKQWEKVCLDFYNNSYGVDIVAVKDGQYIGSTYLAVYPKSEPKKAWTDHLGVIKEFRRIGLATALKIKAIESLLNKGITEVRTDNEENNPMYKINVALGFKPVPFSLEYMKEI